MDTEREEALIQKAQEDIHAFGELYDEYYSRIFNYALRRTASIDTAQDVTSDVFLKALNNIKRYQYKGIRFSSWLYRIAANEITDYYWNNRGGKYGLEEAGNLIDNNTPSPDAELLEAEAEMQRNEEFLILHRSIAMLPIKYQEVITLRFFEYKQIKEIGEILGKREGTVKSLLNRGLVKLRSLMT